MVAEKLQYCNFGFLPALPTELLSHKFLGARNGVEPFPGSVASPVFYHSEDNAHWVIKFLKPLLSYSSL